MERFDYVLTGLLFNLLPEKLASIDVSWHDLRLLLATIVFSRRLEINNNFIFELARTHILFRDCFLRPIQSAIVVTGCSIAL